MVLRGTGSRTLSLSFPLLDEQHWFLGTWEVTLWKNQCSRCVEEVGVYIYLIKEWWKLAGLGIWNLNVKDFIDEMFRRNLFCSLLLYICFHHIVCRIVTNIVTCCQMNYDTPFSDLYLFNSTFIIFFI